VHQAGLGTKELCRKHGIRDAKVSMWRSTYVLDRPKTERKPEAIHHRQLDDLGVGIEVLDGECSLMM